MISYDTFSGSRARVREANLDYKELLVLAEHLTPLLQLMTLQIHNVGNVLSALVTKLLRQILASMDQEERRRNELVVRQQQQLQPMAPTLFWS
ncbi:unnamed protein product [Peronospora destructor]|uniref:Uncharacterized protein n=1 Tax=Peronospora destructor TaxID=86335 RepID=A0AAV0TKX6_9STRA|nr:unnamed protein product [Peronospora destructor]